MDPGDGSGAPLFGVAPGNVLDEASESASRSINLDDIFADCFFGPGIPINDGVVAPEPVIKDPGYMGTELPHSMMPLQIPANYRPQSSSRRDAAAAAIHDDELTAADSSTHDDKKRKRPRPQQQVRQMTEQQKVERRERNREHAKRSRVRKKFLLESLQQSVNALQQENEKLRSAIKEHMGTQQAEGLLESCAHDSGSLIANNPNDATRILDDPDYSLVKALQTAQQNFVITDPSLPDNPIVFASQGFLTLTGYKLDQVLGRNCRFLQGPETDPRAVQKIRKAIAEGFDTSVCLLNYRIDGTTFWNQFFVAPLRDSDGNVVNYVGVQCKVSDDFARAIAQSEGTNAAQSQSHAPSQSQSLAPGQS